MKGLVHWKKLRKFCKIVIWSRNKFSTEALIIQQTKHRSKNNVILINLLKHRLQDSPSLSVGNYIKCLCSLSIDSRAIYNGLWVRYLRQYH